MLVTEQRPAAGDADAVHHGRGERPNYQRGHHHTADVCAGDNRSPEHLNHQVRAIDRSWGARAGPLSFREGGSSARLSPLPASPLPLAVLRAAASVRGSRAPGQLRLTQLTSVRRSGRPR